jgi:hypothetical protein
MSHNINKFCQCLNTSDRLLLANIAFSNLYINWTKKTIKIKDSALPTI